MDSSVIIAWVLAHLNYWVVALFMAIESSFIPFPSEVVVPPAAWKAMTDPDMNIVGVVISATIGADIGAFGQLLSGAMAGATFGLSICTLTLRPHTLDR